MGGTATLQGPAVKISVPGIGGTYEGKLDTDAVTITGAWSQGPSPLPLVLKRAPRDGMAHSRASGPSQADGPGCQSRV